MPYTNENWELTDVGVAKIVWRVVLAIAIIWLLFASIFTVWVGERSFTVRFGKINSQVYSEWIHLKNPLLDKVVSMSVKSNRFDRVVASASKDLQNVTTDVTLTYALQDKQLTTLYKEVGTQSTIEDVLVAPTIQESIKAATAKFTAEELITKRTEAKGLMVDLLKAKLEAKGVLVQDLNITNFNFSEQFNVAIESKVTAEQEALKSKNELEKVKYQAQQSIERAKAEAEAIKIQAQAITSQWGAAYVQLKWIEKWNGALPTYSLGENTQFLMDMTK